MKPLTGVRIVSIEHFAAAPYGSMFLADLGADVVKVESLATSGDPARRTGPFFLGENDSEYFQTWNMNKRSVALDLKSIEGRASLEELVATADAVMNNLRGDKSASAGLDYKTLSAVKRSIVCLHITAYGRNNPRAGWPGYDYLMQAEAGLMHLTGEPSGPPARLGAPSIIDHATGLTGAIGLLAGIVQARSTGIGCDVDTCLFDVALHQLGYTALWCMNEGHVATRQPRSSHFALAPVQTFPTSDGWLFVMCMSEKDWYALLDALGRSDLRSDARYDSAQHRLEHRESLTGALDAEFRKGTVDYWLQKLGGVIPVSAVLDVAGALENPFVSNIEMINTIAHPHRSQLRVLSNPIRINGNRLSQTACSPFGADTLSGFPKAGVVVAEEGGAA